MHATPLNNMHHATTTRTTTDNNTCMVLLTPPGSTLCASQASPCPKAHNIFCVQLFPTTLCPKCVTTTCCLKPWHIFFGDVVSDNVMSGYISGTVSCQKHSRQNRAVWIQTVFYRITNMTDSWPKPPQQRCDMVVSASWMSGYLTNCGFYVRNLSDCTFFSRGAAPRRPGTF